jgi:U-box domain
VTAILNKKSGQKASVFFGSVPKRKIAQTQTPDVMNAKAEANPQPTRSASAATPTTMIPDEFICPLTMEIMKNPVVSKYGISFEREAIVGWLGSHGQSTCPMTRQKLRLSDLIPHYRLKLAIQEYLRGDELPLNGNAAMTTPASGVTLGTPTNEEDDDDSDVPPVYGFFTVKLDHDETERTSVSDDEDDDHTGRLNLESVTPRQSLTSARDNSQRLNAEAGPATRRRMFLGRFRRHR